MQGERTPPFPADAGNAIELATFCNNAKERGKWLDGVKDLIEKNEQILASIGKASEIDKLHSEALEFKEKVLAEIERREKKLEKDREEFNREMATKRHAFEHERDVTSRKVQEMEQMAADSLKAAERKKKEAKEAWATAKQAQQEAERHREQVKALQQELRQKSDEAAALAQKLSA